MSLSNFLNKESKYLLACSYGPDSMSLFDMLLKGGYSFEVAHVNYALRPEAKKETDDLIKYCNSHRIKLHTLFAVVDKNKNIEEECRIIRYTYFASLYKNSNFEALLVAHNEDDLIETYIMQKERNIYANYYGISQKTRLFGVPVIRPLLEYKKAELEKYCKDNNVPYCIDSSNLLNTFLRNKIRHNVVSKMSEDDRKNIINEIYKKNLKQEEMIAHISSIDVQDIKSLLKLDDDEFCLAINHLFRYVVHGSAVSGRCCMEIKNILLSKKPNIVFKINEKVSFVKEYGKCFFASNKKEGDYSFVVPFPTLIDNEYFHFDLEHNLDKHNLVEDDFPLTIRNYKDGDVYFIRDYAVPVRRLFIDWKLPMLPRKRWPLLVNKYGVIKYIPRYRKDFNINTTPDFFVKL